MTSNTLFVQQEIRRGIQAFKAGNKKTAWLHFQAALREDEKNVTALLWLAFLANGYEKQHFLLERVLVIDPDNQRAKDGLIWLQAKQPAPLQRSEDSDVTDLAAETEPPDSDVDTELLETGEDEAEVLLKQRLHKTLGTSELKEKAKKGTIAQRARRRIGPLFLILIFGAISISMMLNGHWFGIGISRASSQATEFDHPDQGQTVSISVTKPVAATKTQTPPPTPTSPPTKTPTSPPTSTPLPPTPTPKPLAYQPQSEHERWIEVDLSEQQVTAWEGTTAVMSFTASTGLPNTPTQVGQFRVYQKYSATRMVGPGYNLPNVPFTMYYDRGYAVHGAYWHDNFGEPMSHGCVNLSPDDAEAIFSWAGPTIPAGETQATASLSNPGTLVVVHQ